MLVRFRRNRLFIFGFISICFLIYWLNKHDANDGISVDTDTQLIGENDKKKHEFPDKSAPTLQKLPTTPRIVREEIIEINGRKLKKIDWHDYDFIAREQARTGLLNVLFLNLNCLLLFIRIG